MYVVVGNDYRLHVRGKEKKIEAPVHTLSEYMPFARHKTIFLATDDEDNVAASVKFTNYTWVMVTSKEYVVTCSIKCLRGEKAA